VTNKFNKTTGVPAFSDGSILPAADLNDTFGYTIPPIGAVIAWLKSYTNTPATLPAGWVECNGQTLNDSDSCYDGQTLPNLNASGGGTQRFLRGSTTSGTTGGADSYNHTHAAGNTLIRGTQGSSGICWDGNYASSGASTAPALPSYYEVVWIMRIK
jgi:hypothetical protein